MARDLYDRGMSIETPWVYFDGNAVSRLWDWHTEIHPEGKTGGPRSATPFQHAVLSDYSLDEILTIPIGNAYQKHLLLLTVFPDMPVLRALNVVDIPVVQAKRAELLRPAGYTENSVCGPLLALHGHAASVRARANDIENKHARIRADVDAAAGRQHVPKRFRVPFGTAVAMAVETHGLNPAGSAKDFLELCLVLYSFEISRFIDRPSSERKGPSRQLNQLIDHYHLAYLPFVDTFVTDDVVLRQMASDLAAAYRPTVEVESVTSYHEKWIRQKLLE